MLKDILVILLAVFAVTTIAKMFRSLISTIISIVIAIIVCIIVFGL